MSLYLAQYSASSSPEHRSPVFKVAEQTQMCTACLVRPELKAWHFAARSAIRSELCVGVLFACSMHAMHLVVLSVVTALRMKVGVGTSLIGVGHRTLS